MSGPKLEAETTLIIDETDMAAILTEHFCGSSYDAFAFLRVEMVAHDKQNNAFTLKLTPKPEKEEA